MDRPSALRVLVLGWALMYAGRDGWMKIDDFHSSTTCQQVRDADVANDVRREIGSVLASQPADNPMRQEAYVRAERRVRERYLCAWQD